MTLFQFFAALISISVALSAIMSVAWVIQQRTGNSGWVDTVWTFGLGLTGAVAALTPMAGAYEPRQFIVAAFAAIWAARLGIHIASRTTKIVDDPRYAISVLVEHGGFGAGAAAPRAREIMRVALLKDAEVRKRIEVPLTPTPFQPYTDEGGVPEPPTIIGPATAAPGNPPA